MGTSPGYEAPRQRAHPYKNRPRSESTSTTRHPSAAGTMATPTEESAGASIFANASDTRVLTGEINNSQRDVNSTTVIINVGGSNSETSRTTLGGSEATEPASVRNTSSDQDQEGHSDAMGSNSDASRATLEASETTRPCSVTNTSSGREQSPILEESGVSTDLGLGGDTSLEIMTLPTEGHKPAKETVAISKVVYKHHMLLQANGMPLYIPQPGSTDCRSYQRQGVSIGDVGVFTSSGGFDRFFNICLPVGHPTNPDVLPEGFYPLDLEAADIYEVYGYAFDSYIASPPVPRMGTTFRCPKLEGAILALPRGAYQEDLRRKVKRFRDYTSIHLRSWYDYANVVHGQEIDNKNIHLVIGCDKTTSWGIATYSHRQSTCIEDNVTNLSFDLKDEGRDSLYPKYAWGVDGMAAGLKVGPEEVELLDPPAVHAIRPLRNQCTFVRSLNPALGEDEWEQHQLKVAASPEPPASPRPTQKNSLASVLGAIRSLPSRLGSLGGHGTSRLTESMAPAQSLANHPSTPILDMLLQKCPRAKVVVVNDSDWCSVVRDSDEDWITTAQDLPHRIQEAFDIVEDGNGTAYLREKKKSSQHHNTLPHVKTEDDLPLLRDRTPGPLQLPDSLETSSSDMEVGSPPQSSKLGLFDWNDDIKPSIYHNSVKDNDNEDYPMLDPGVLEFTFSQSQKVEHDSSEEIALGGETNDSQKDQNADTFNRCMLLHIGGSNSDPSCAILAASETTRPGSVGNILSARDQSSILGKSSILATPGFGGDTSMETMSAPADENPIQEETSNAIYQRHMRLKNHGTPLWIPQPDKRFSRSYRRQGVSIGDVGTFNSNGGFDFLFNICLPVGHPRNPNELPEDFSCLVLKSADVCEFRLPSSHSPLTSSSVKKHGATFECSGSDGAILTMPEGAYREDLRDVRQFQRYASIHARSWYQYASVRHSLDIGNGDLHLVVGCDKTTSWGIATYSHLQSKRFEDNVTRLSFKISNEGRHPLYPTYSWDYEGVVKTKAGPEEDEIMDLAEVQDSAPLRNQCTFIRSFTLALSGDDWGRLQSKADASRRNRPSRKNPPVSVLGAISSLPDHIDVGPPRITESLAPARRLAAHPATYVIDMLLKKCPKAKVVVVRDSDWCSVIRDSDDNWMSTSQDLQHRIQKAFDIVEEENGTVYLQEKTGSSQHPNTSSHVSVKSGDKDRVLFEVQKPEVLQLFNAYEICPPNDSPSRSFEKIVDNGDGGAKSNLFEDSGEAYLGSMEGFVRRDTKLNFGIPSDDEAYLMSDATMPKITSQVNKRKNVSRDDTIFSDDFFASSNTGTLSFRESPRQLIADDSLATENANHHDPGSRTRIRETNLSRTAFFQNDSNDTMLDNNLTSSSKPLTQIRSVASKAQTGVIQKKRKYPGSFTCSLCNQTFATNVKLKSHRTAHSSYKPHPCRHCLRAFSTQKSLLRHLELKTCTTLRAMVLLEPIQQPNQENHMRPSRGVVAPSQRVAGQPPLSFLPQPSSDLPSLPHTSPRRLPQPLPSPPK